MYSAILGLHGAWRWAVLATALLAIVAAVIGLTGKRAFSPLGRKTGLLYVAALDMQFLLGLILLATSPLIAAAFTDMGAAMKVKELRFFTVEHTIFMLVAVVLAHVGSARAKRAAKDRLKYRRMLVWNAASLGVVLVGIPWWRPLLRGLVAG